jgi:xyloglucan-specific exo-beta-1,4-glucanase
MSHITERIHPRMSFLHASFLLAVMIAMVSRAAFGQANAAGYTWSNVYTGGGGGYIPNIIFNPSQQNLIYARTDIGGAYKWNSTTNLWVPLMDWVTWANWNELGVESIATDPVNPNNLYIMAGLYTNSFTTMNGTLLISNNQGSTFTQVPMPFKVGGNMPARNMGERLAVDPNLNSTLFFAARSGNGLWESTNSGATWSKVTSFPQPGTYAVEPGDIFNGDIIGPAWVVFDPRTGSAGKATQTIYVGVAQPDGTNIYVTKNGGTTWAAVAGQPTCTLTGTQTTGTVACTNGATWSVASDAPGPGFFPNRAVLAPTTGMLYITYSNGAGPYDGTMGDVQQYNTATGAWTEISPVVPTTLSGADYFGYSGLAVDPEVPTTIMVSAFNSWWPDTILWRSTNSGATWSQIWNWTSYPSRSFMYTLNDTAAPWANEGDTNPVAPIEAPELGWMVSGLAIDPFNSNHMLYGTGMTMWGTENLTQWDAGNQFALSIASQGIEETSVLDLVSPPAGGGAHLYSALGDIGGFIHTSMTTAPTFPYAIPFFGTRTSIDYAELSPQFMVLVGDGSPTASPAITSSAFTFSGGTSETAWFAGTVDPPGYSTNGGGTVAAAADASRVVWNPTGMGAFYSTANGSSWTASTGLPAGGIIASDRVSPLQFYDYAAGQFYVSTNGGVSFAATAATGLPAAGDSVNFRAVPGHQGDIWLAGGSTNAGDVYGLWHSTNSGASFTQLASVTQADIIGFGKAAPGATYPTLFTNAEIGGIRGIFASTNEGATWTQINDSAHEYGLTGATITGDPQTFGTVYLGTNGRGIITGTGTPPFSSSTGSFTLAPSASTLSVTQGSNATDTVTVTDVSPFTGSVTLAASGLPSGVTAAFGTNPTTGSSLVTLTASSTATTGAATVTITGTSGTLTATTSIALTVNPPSTGSFTLKPSAATLSVTRGSSATDTITVTDVSPFNGSVTLAASGLPSGVTAAFGTNPTTGSSVLTLTASSTATTGAATVTITGTAGTLTATTTIALTVNPAASFTLAPSAPTLSVTRGSSGTDTVTVTDVGGFTGSVTLAASGLPSGVTAAFGTNPTTGSSVLTLTASSTATTGAATVTITGTSGTVTASTTIALTVNPAASFTLAPSASTLPVTQGSKATDTITVTDVGGFTGSVTLAASGLPSGVTAAFGTNPTTGSSVLTLTASSTATTGAATVTITGTSGTLAPVTTSISLTVTSVTGSFTLKPSAATLSIAQGANGTDTITVTDVSPFTGSVTFAATGQPSGVTASFSPASSTTSSVVTFTVAATTVAGTYPITITGTSGTVTATTAIALTVSPSGTGAKCTIDYTISSQWQGGFGAAITINNTGTTALTNWTLTWAFANGQTVTQLWNGTETQSGANVTVTNLSYNGSIPAGGSYSGMGFNGSWNNTTNAIPTAFSLNGTACTVN